MRKSFVHGLLLALALVAPATAQVSPDAPALANEDEKTLYAVGLSVYRNLAALDLSPAEVEIVQRAITDAAAGRPPAVKLEDYMAKIGELQRARTARRAEAEKARGKAFLDTAAAEAGAVKTESGMVYLETQAGTGAAPTAADTVSVHYRGTLVDGTEFDSSAKRGEPAKFPLGRVIPCWTEGLQKMKVGGKAKLVCPSELAYGDRGRPSIPPGATLTFEVELLEVLKAEAAPAAPTVRPAPAPTPAPTPPPTPGS